MIARCPVVILAFPDVQLLDVAGPAEVFSQADRLAGGDGYELELIGSGRQPLASSSGLTVVPDRSVEECRGPIDTLVVAGGRGVRPAVLDERLVSGIRLAARRSRRVSSVCTGAFLLARAGLLDGRGATTHWGAVRALQREHPAIAVQADPIFVRDGNVYTSAGVTAGIDLALALVEEDRTLDELPDPGVIVVPGGSGTRALMADETMLAWLRAAHTGSQWTTSVCTGSLLLAAAGILDGLEATTHWLAFDLLGAYDVTPVSRRVVEQGKVITSAGVASGIDMALTLAARIAGPELAQAIQLGIEYDPQPPFRGGSVASAPPEIVELVRRRAAELA
jgi:transcriptional regulator GlxA family with amidase domain